MAGRGLVSRAIDRLPGWEQAILAALGIIFFIYSVAHYGLASTLLHTIFSPEL
jgi:hypothetical protein